jgi:hypothetical protein
MQDEYSTKYETQFLADGSAFRAQTAAAADDAWQQTREAFILFNSPRYLLASPRSFASFFPLL